MTDWTDPDHADEEWVQPWEEWGGLAGVLAEWWSAYAHPRHRMAAEIEADVDLFGEPDFFSPRARWVSDRE